MATALIALGSNLGDRRQNLETALSQLAGHSGIRLVTKSSFHSTRPIGGPPGQGDFLNAAARLETSLSLQELHSVLKATEAAVGRVRADRWGPRTLDLDLLLYDEQVVETPELTVPHPRMAFRRFVLEPAAEIAPDMRHPTIGWTVAELRDHVRTRTPYVAAITGVVAADKTALAIATAAAIAGRIIRDPDPVDISLDAIRASRRSFDEVLELLERRARPIRMTGWTSSDFMLVSDYLFDESQILFMSVIDRRGEFTERFEELSNTLSRPKLLAILNSPLRASWFIEAIIASTPIQSRMRETMVGMGTALSSHVATSWRGPLLRLEASKPEEARDELVAAIQGMQ